VILSVYYFSLPSYHAIFWFQFFIFKLFLGGGAVTYVRMAFKKTTRM